MATTCTQVPNFAAERNSLQHIELALNGSIQCSKYIPVLCNCLLKQMTSSVAWEVCLLNALKPRIDPTPKISRSLGGGFEMSPIQPERVLR
jgi:hypothetical protein